MVAQEPPGDVEPKQVVMRRSERRLQKRPQQQVENVGTSEALRRRLVHTHLLRRLLVDLIARRRHGDGV